jgi:pimeloyl-ACP methyl ester carboxylesterase
MTLARHLHGADSGRPPLLLLHGLGSDHSVWRPVIEPLAEHFTLVVVDLPGHGQSPPFPPGADASPRGLAGSVSVVLDELGHDQVHVAGSSLGGWVALELALLGRARSVTALAPAGFWDQNLVPVVAHVNRWASRAVAPVAPQLLRITPLRTIGFWTASADPAAMDPQQATDAVRAHAGARGWARALAGTHRRRVDARDLSADVPVTIVWGDRDRILPTDRCEVREGSPPHARWVRLSQCGHVPMWDRPAETVELIRQTAAAAGPAAVEERPPAPPAASRRRAAAG